MSRYLYRDYGKIEDRVRIETMLRHNIACVAFASNGEWYLQSGDEFGSPGIYDEDRRLFAARRGIPQHGCRKLVFRLPPEYEGQNMCSCKWHGAYDLSNFIKMINITYKHLVLPQPADWVEILEIGPMGHLLVFVRHSGTAFSGEIRLILVNTTQEEISLNEGQFRDIIRQYQAETQSRFNFFEDSHQLILVGKIRLNVEGIKATIISIDKKSGEVTLVEDKGAAPPSSERPPV